MEPNKFSGANNAEIRMIVKISGGSRGVLASLIVVGPFIFLYKLSKATNMLAEHYNVNG